MSNRLQAMARLTALLECLVDGTELLAARLAHLEADTVLLHDEWRALHADQVSLSFDILTTYDHDELRDRMTERLGKGLAIELEMVTHQAAAAAGQ